MSIVRTNIYTFNVTLFGISFSCFSTGIHQRMTNWLLAKMLPLFLFVELEKADNAMSVICILTLSHRFVTAAFQFFTIATY